MNELTSTLKALSDRNRLRTVVALLSYDELCACQITALMQVAGATVSRHMGLLIAAGLVESRKEGRWVYYRLQRERPRFKMLLDWVKGELGNDPVVELDSKKLKEITSCELEKLCKRLVPERKNRGLRGLLPRRNIGKE